MPIDDLSIPAGAAQQSGSFKERKMQQLATERGQEPAPQAQTPHVRDPEEQAPSRGGSAEDVEQEGRLDDNEGGLYAEDDYDESDDQDLEALDAEAPSEDAGGELDEEESPYQKRYEDLRAEFNRYLEEHKGFEREHAESMSQHLELRFQLEDTLQEAAQRAEFLYNTMSGNAARYKNIDWSQVPADQVQAVQAQAQQAFQMEQQAAHTFEQIRQHAEQTKTMVKQREAAIAKTRLRRTIPGWSNEVYGELREFANNSGMAPQAFNEITDPVIIEWAYAAKQLQDATRKGGQKRTTKRKAQAPTSRQPRQQTRNDRGQYAKKQVVPNQRGSFADKHRHRLAMERRGGR